jgi:hypothetical protein
MSQFQRQSPYQGLNPYREEDADFFFGRERETRLVIANLFASPLTLLYGSSGVGKSSLLEAGVVRSLRQRHDLLVVSFRDWQSNPINGLKASIADAAWRDANETLDLSGSFPIADYLEECSARLNRHMMVILDQFEEYFLYHPHENGRGTFATEFPDAVNRLDLSVSFLIAIREDSLAKLDRFEGRIPNLFDNYLRLDYLGHDAAVEAIEKPIEQYNRLLPENSQPVNIEPELIDAVLDQVKTGQVVLGEVGRGSVAPHAVATATEMRIETPYLQLVMTRLWDQEISRGSRTLRLETLNRLGGAERIVRTHLDGVMEALSQSEQRTAANIFQYLVTTSGSKIAYPVLDLAGTAGLQESELISLMEKLSSGDMRILRPVGPVPGRPAEPRYERYEIFHDVLGPAILEWRARFEERERESARQEELALERKRVRRLRYGIVGLAFLFVIMAGLVALAVYQTKQAELHQQAADKQRQEAVAQKQEADKQRQEADVQRHIALSRQLAAQAMSLIPQDLLDRALLLSQEALRASETIEARDALMRALQHNPRLTASLRGHDGWVDSLSFSSDGKILASVGDDGSVVLWDTQRGQRIGEPLKIPGDVRVSSVAFSPDSKILASGGYEMNGSVILWDTQRRQQLVEPLQIPGNSWVNSVAFSPDGRILAFGSDNGSVILWDTQRGQQLGEPLRIPGDSWVSSIAFSSDGKILASVGVDNVGGRSSVILWDTQRGQRIGEPLKIPGDVGVSSVAFSPDSKILTSVGDDGSVILWDVDIESWKERACRTTNRNLTRLEWKQYLENEPYNKTCSNVLEGR